MNADYSARQLTVCLLFLAIFVLAMFVEAR